MSVAGEIAGCAGEEERGRKTNYLALDNRILSYCAWLTIADDVLATLVDLGCQL